MSRGGSRYFAARTVPLIFAFESLTLRVARCKPSRWFHAFPPASSLLRRACGPACALGGWLAPARPTHGRSRGRDHDDDARDRYECNVLIRLIRNRQKFRSAARECHCASAIG